MPALATPALENMPPHDLDLNDARECIRPIPTDRLIQIVSKIVISHPGKSPSELRGMHYHFFLMLRHFPEDLVCAAYRHVARLTPKGNAFEVMKMVHFMEPEMSHRLSRARWNR